MSGHSKWSQIKHKKAANDQKRSAVFSKLLKLISVAARQESDPQFNPALRAAIEKAKEANVPSDNIERAIKKSSEQSNVDELLIEAYGPHSIAVLIAALTDNRNRTVAELKKIITDKGGKWADPGSVTWAFEKSGAEWKAQFPQDVSDEQEDSIISFLEALDDHPDVSEVYTNTSLTTS